MTAQNEALARFRAKDAFVTVGIASAIGTVLGLSTLPFYDSPFSHLSNVYIGAGAGLVAGVGVAAYLFANSYFGDEEEIGADELLVPKKKVESRSAVNPGASEGQDPRPASEPPAEEEAPKKSDSDAGSDDEAMLQKSRRSYSSVTKTQHRSQVGMMGATSPNKLPAPGLGQKEWVVAVRVLELRF